MPIYEYRCGSCGAELERLVPRTAPPPPCPQCAETMTKKVSASSFILQGGGWYKDHYGLKKESAGESKGEPKAEAKGDSSTAPAASSGDGASTPAKADSATPAPAAQPASAPKASATPSSSPAT